MHTNVHWILQARILEWVAISLNPGDLSDPGIKPRSPALQADVLTSEPPGKPGVQMLNATKLNNLEFAIYG